MKIAVLYQTMYGKQGFLRVATSITDSYANAFEEMGHTVKRINMGSTVSSVVDNMEGINENDTLLISSAILYSRIFAFEPDLIFLYSLSLPPALFSLDKSGFFKKVPIISMYGDEGLDNLCVNDPPNADNTYLFLNDRGWIKDLADYGFSANYIPLAVDTRLFNLPENSVKKRYPVSFVGTYFYDYYRQSYMDKGYKKWINSMAIKFLNGKPFYSIFNEYIDSEDEKKYCSLFYDEYKKYPHLIGKDEKPTTLESIKDKVYVDVISVLDYISGRNAMLLPEGINFNIDMFTSGIVSKLSHLKLHKRIPYNRLHEVYKKSTINLNFMKSVMRHGVTQRVFDVPATKSFLLTEYRPSLDELFEPGTYASFRSREEMIEKVNYYKSHRKMRENIVMQMYDQVMAKHTYQHRAAEMLDLVLSKKAVSLK